MSTPPPREGWGVSMPPGVGWPPISVVSNVGMVVPGDGGVGEGWVGDGGDGEGWGGREPCRRRDQKARSSSSMTLFLPFLCFATLLVFASSLVFRRRLLRCTTPSLLPPPVTSLAVARRPHDRKTDASMIPLSTVIVVPYCNLKGRRISSSSSICFIHNIVHTQQLAEESRWVEWSISNSCRVSRAVSREEVQFKLWRVDFLAPSRRN